MPSGPGVEHTRRELAVNLLGGEPSLLPVYAPVVDRCGGSPGSVWHPY
jgi:hypothetical protein